MEDSKNMNEINEKHTESNNWKEYQDFYNAHNMQLYGMNFPENIGEKLFYKLKYEIFDSTRFFQIIDNPKGNSTKSNATVIGFQTGITF